MQNSVKRTQEEKADFLRANGLVEGHIEESISNSVFEVPALLRSFVVNLQGAGLSKYIAYYKKLDSFLSPAAAGSSKQHLEYLIAHGDVNHRHFAAASAPPSSSYEYEKFLNFKGFYKVDLQASKEPAVTWHVEEVVDISENLDKWLIAEESPADEAEAPDHTSPSLLLHAEFRDHLNSELEEVAAGHAALAFLPGSHRTDEHLERYIDVRQRASCAAQRVVGGRAAASVGRDQATANRTD